MAYGAEQCIVNLHKEIMAMRIRVGIAAEEIARVIEYRAKRNHGDTPRESTTVYPPKESGRAPWDRPGGFGWADVTGKTQQTTHAYVEETLFGYKVILTTGTDYSYFLELAMEQKWAWLFQAILDEEVLIKQILKQAMIPNVALSFSQPVRADGLGSHMSVSPGGTPVSSIVTLRPD